MIVLLLCTFQAFACDVCGVYSAIEPNSFNSRIGIRYRSAFYKGVPIMGLKHTGFKDLEVKEIFDYYEVFGRYYHQKSRIAVQGVLPVVNRYRSINGITESDNWGIGDAKLQVVYRAVNSEVTAKVIHRLDVGLGLKMPLGSTNKRTNGMLSDIDMQLGSGSWDVFASLQYVMKIKSWAMSVDANYQFNNNGRTGYHYGDMVSSNLKAFYLWKKKDWTISPVLGVGVDMIMEDRENGQLYYDSGALVFSGNVGLNVYWKQLQFNGSFGAPMVQYFKGLESPLQYRFSVGLVYNI